MNTHIDAEEVDPLFNIVYIVSEYYLNSGDFNGMSFRALAESVGEEIAIEEKMVELIRDDALFISHSKFVINPHIIMYPPESIETQLGLIASGELKSAVLYPTARVLQKIVDTSRYAHTPLRLYLALGNPQLGVVLFYPSVLEQYRNDPRYLYETDDIVGRLVISDEYFETADVPESDQIILSRFGFAVSKTGHRAVAAMLRDLANLSDEHQQIWHARAIPSELVEKHHFHLIKEYQQVLNGERRQRCSLTTAFMYEMNAINEICNATYKKRIFNRDWIDGFARLSGLTMMLSPTIREYHNFIHLLDKILSDNINKKFFEGHVSFERETALADGRIKVENKGTLALLKEWLGIDFPREGARISTIMASLNRVRKERQKPAHTIEMDKFDPSLWAAQRSLLAEAHGGLKALRQLLSDNLSFSLSGSTHRQVNMPISDD
ncbi:hypothetical protein [Burkholderia gladioli]|uniref:Uncharacterized protein n=1 Tax=Burkholderia gladioli TaxID=28095 RepID=A0AB38TLG9_BURGA|nr:hypothetical protein [Burkholderia gladioli]UWX69161.1 hypothetical protein NYZ96_13150 [Burkholderia gladioli]